MKPRNGRARTRGRLIAGSTVVLMGVAMFTSAASGAANGLSRAASTLTSFSKTGGLDCNGQSPIQKPLRGTPPPTHHTTTTTPDQKSRSEALLW